MYCAPGPCLVGGGGAGSLQHVVEYAGPEAAPEEGVSVENAGRVVVVRLQYSHT